MILKVLNFLESFHLFWRNKYNNTKSQRDFAKKKRVMASNFRSNHKLFGL